MKIEIFFYTKIISCRIANTYFKYDIERGKYILTFILFIINY